MIENLYLNAITSPELLLRMPIEDQTYCGICTKKVGVRHKTVFCNLNCQWNHMKCEGIDNKTFFCN